jgi:hypothetical protein
LTALGVLEPTLMSVNYITPVDGNITITPANIGLGNVNNTSDINKPISNAAQQAINVLRLEGTDAYKRSLLNWLIRHRSVSFSNCNRIDSFGI